MPITTTHKQKMQLVLENIKNRNGKTIRMDLNLLQLWNNGGSAKSKSCIEGWEAYGMFVGSF